MTLNHMTMMKLKKENLSVVEITNLASSESSSKNELLELKNYCDVNRVLHVTAWIRRFINNARKKQTLTGCKNVQKSSKRTESTVEVSVI